MTTTYFRVQSADRDPRDLLDAGWQFSRAWSGAGAAREGVSVCATVDDLALYLASHLGSGIPVAEGWSLVEVEGDQVVGSTPVDPEFETLIRPTRIVSVRPVDADFMAAVAAAGAELDGYAQAAEFDD